MPVTRTQHLIKETAIGKNTGYITSEEIALFIIKRYFHYGLLAMMHGYVFGSQMHFAIKMKYTMYYDIPVKLKKMFKYSTRLFGYAFHPVPCNAYIRKHGYNFKPAPELLDRIAEVTDTDQIFKLIKP